MPQYFRRLRLEAREAEETTPQTWPTRPENFQTPLDSRPHLLPKNRRSSHRYESPLPSAQVRIYVRIRLVIIFMVFVPLKMLRETWPIMRLNPVPKLGPNRVTVKPASD